MNAPRFKPTRLCATLAALLGSSVCIPTSAQAATAAPKLDYQLVGETISRTESTYLPTTPTRYGSLDGLYRHAQIANIQAGEAANVISQLPSNAPFVVGRYAAASGQLVVDIYKVERIGTRTGVYRAAFTPAHGQLWANAGTYKAPGTSGPGADPFARFVDASDANVFAGVSFDAVEVIIGHAMRYVSSPFAVLAAATPRTEQRMETTRNSHLRKTVRVEVSSYLDPKWYIAAPPSFQGEGSSAAICLHASGTCTATPYLVAPAMVTFQEWQGGTMPSTPTYLGQDVFTDSSSFKFDNFVVAAYVYTFAASSMQATVQNSSSAATGLTAALQSYNTEGASRAITQSPSDAGLYAGMSSVLDQGSLSTVQSGYRSSAGTGQIPKQTPSGTLATRFVSQSRQLAILADPTNGGMEGVRSYYVGDCSAVKLLSECASPMRSGVLPRADTYVELDAARLYQDTTP